MIVSSRNRIVIALLYLVFISILFCLPGSALPKNNWLSKIHFDKLVHIGFFLVLVVSWLWALKLFKKGIVVLLISAAVYGLLVELVQDRLIANRSFDLGDLVADMAGALAGLWFWNRYIKK